MQVDGPLDPADWVAMPNYDRFFSQPDSVAPEARKAYARERIARFASRAFRRPAEDRVVDRLVRIAEEGYNQPGKSVEFGISRAMVAVLASPRFLFRDRRGRAGRLGCQRGGGALDEFALASRLSYFLLVDGCPTRR